MLDLFDWTHQFPKKHQRINIIKYVSIKIPNVGRHCELVNWFITFFPNSFKFLELQKLEKWKIVVRFHCRLRFQSDLEIFACILESRKWGCSWTFAISEDSVGKQYCAGLFILLFNNVFIYFIGQLAEAPMSRITGIRRIKWNIHFDYDHYHMVLKLLIAAVAASQSWKGLSNHSMDSRGNTSKVSLSIHWMAFW